MLTLIANLLWFLMYPIMLINTPRLNRRERHIGFAPVWRVQLASIYVWVALVLVGAVLFNIMSLIVWQLVYPFGSDHNVFANFSLPNASSLFFWDFDSAFAGKHWWNSRPLLFLVLLPIGSLVDAIIIYGYHLFHNLPLGFLALNLFYLAWAARHLRRWLERIRIMVKCSEIQLLPADEHIAAHREYLIRCCAEDVEFRRLYAGFAAQGEQGVDVCGQQDLFPVASAASEQALSQPSSPIAAVAAQLAAPKASRNDYYDWHG